MKLIIDTDALTVYEEYDGKTTEHFLYSKEAYEKVAQLWLKLGWQQKYAYTFTWMGRPVIQLPEDMLRIQEVIFQLQPDVIVETGVAHGGSLIFYASLCELIGHGDIIGVDIEIRPHNRKAIESHSLSKRIQLIEGNAIAKQSFQDVTSRIQKGQKVLVILDSCHSKEHVLEELRLYSQLVSQGSYIIATDGIMQDLYELPRAETSWKSDNPVEAVNEFLKQNHNFKLESPAWLFNESELTESLSYWPSSFLKRTS